MPTKIEWTDETWSPVTGCDKVSPGCDNCYIDRSIPFRMEGRKFDEHGRMGIRLHDDRLYKPLRWKKKPRRVFVNSLSDLFHVDLTDEFIAKVFAVMAISPEHTFQVLTKRPQRMQKLVDGVLRDLVEQEIDEIALDELAPLTRVRRAELQRDIKDRWGRFTHTEWPLPNVWLGTSFENQRYADLRIPYLLDTSAAKRFLSMEPLLGAVDLSVPTTTGPQALPIDWVIVGGESGPGARPMHPDWARSLRDQCVDAKIPFFFKQAGEWGWPASPDDHVVTIDGRLFEPHARLGMDHMLRPTFIRKVGKKAAGRILDGRLWDEFPA